MTSLNSNKSKSRVVFVGGGHANCVAINVLQPKSFIEYICISPSLNCFYSGMLPGVIAGHYAESEALIPLARLCDAKGVRFIKAEVIAIDAEKSCLELSTGDFFTYDVLSLDIGTSSRRVGIQGAELAIPVKPMDSFLQSINAVELQEKRGDALSVAVVGGGASGVELALALAVRFKAKLKPVEIHLLSSSDDILLGFPVNVRLLAARKLADYAIKLHKRIHVTEIKAEQLLAAGELFRTDVVFLAFAGGVPLWLFEPACKNSRGLARSNDGCVLVNSSLQSVSHSNIFSTGDMATLQESPKVRKAGVFAVRQGSVLMDNIHRFVGNKVLLKFTPQRHFLSLLTLGGKDAAASRSVFLGAGRLVWYWKRWIDKRFVRQFLLTVKYGPKLK